MPSKKSSKTKSNEDELLTPETAAMLFKMGYTIECYVDTFGWYTFRPHYLHGDDPLRAFKFRHNHGTKRRGGGG